MSFFHGHDRHHPRRRFLRKSFEFLGTLAAAAGAARGTSAKAEGASKAEKEIPPRPKPGEATLATKQARRKPLHAFDAHLHCPSESGNVWQWHPVTRTFEEFVHYLDRTGVQRGIINSVR